MCTVYCIVGNSLYVLRELCEQMCDSCKDDLLFKKKTLCRLLVVKEKLAESHKHYKELEDQTNRDTTQVSFLTTSLS